VAGGGEGVGLLHRAGGGAEVAADVDANAGHADGIQGAGLGRWEVA
jgi:hypothetical protein